MCDTREITALSLPDIDNFGNFLFPFSLLPVTQEPADSLPNDHLLDMNVDGKLHVLFGGTKIVQHTAPPKTGHSTGSQAAAIIRGESFLFYLIFFGKKV